MATLEQLSTGSRHTLSSRHLIGRAAICALMLGDRRVSGEHAVLCWNGEHWEVQDLGSRNGTFVHGDRLPPGGRRRLKQGDVLAFGDRAEQFALTDDAPPVAMACAADGTRRLAEEGLLILPDPERPLITIYEGGRGDWVAELSDGERRTVADREPLLCDGAVWEIYLPNVVETTWQPTDDQIMLHHLMLRFQVSRDEEHVQMTLAHRDGAIDLGARSHGHLLLALARARLRDREDPSLQPSEHGWMYFPDLIDELGTNETALNVAIYRARKQFAQAHVTGAMALFERRQPTQIRIGLSRLEILPL